MKDNDEEMTLEEKIEIVKNNNSLSDSQKEYSISKIIEAHEEGLRPIDIMNRERKLTRLLEYATQPKRITFDTQSVQKLLSNDFLKSLEDELTSQDYYYCEDDYVSNLIIVLDPYDFFNLEHCAIINDKEKFIEIINSQFSTLKSLMDSVLENEGITLKTSVGLNPYYCHHSTMSLYLYTNQKDTEMLLNLINDLLKQYPEVIVKVIALK